MSPTTVKLTKNQREIEKEIEWYGCRSAVARILRKLGKLGYECTGHGMGFGAEDFSFGKDKNSVGVVDTGRSVKMFISRGVEKDEDILLFEGNADKGLKCLESDTICLSAIPYRK